MPPLTSRVADRSPRAIAGPEAEEATSYGPGGAALQAPVREEANAIALGKPAGSPANSTDLARKGGRDRSATRAANGAVEKQGFNGAETAVEQQGPRTSVEQQGISASDEPPEPETDTHFTLVRATTRFALDLRKLSPAKKSKADAASPKAPRELSELEKAARSALTAVATMATTARNLALRASYRADSEKFDAHIASNPLVPEPGKALPRLPKPKDIEYAKSYSYPLIRKALPTLASGIASALSREVDRKWSSERWDVLHAQNSSPPHYRVGQPFPVRAQDVRWLWDDGGKHAVATVTLFSGQDSNSWRLPIVARDAHQTTVLKALASGEWKAGEVRIERDRLQPAKWYLRVGYKRRVERRTTGIKAAVNRGMSAFLVLMTEKGETLIYDGNDIEAHLRAIQNRRRSYQRGIKMSARVGRGRPKALQSIEHLISKGERWRQTRCQVIARRAAKWLAERDVRVVYLDDFTGIRDAPLDSLLAKGESRRRWIWERIQEWPYYQLGQRLADCLREYGIEVFPQEVVGNSMHCPECHYESPRNINLAHHTFVCRNPDRRHGDRPGCGYRRHLDVAFCKNALQRSTGDERYRVGPRENKGLRGGSDDETGTARKPRDKSAERKRSGETSGNGNGEPVG